MAWTIISIRAPSCVVDDPHNAIFRTSDDIKYTEDDFSAKSITEQSDHGTPAPTSLPPDVTLALTTDHFPKDPSVGFVFGTDRDRCDILLPSLSEFGISKRQFAITFQTTTGAVLLRNLSKQRTIIILRGVGRRIRLKEQRVLPQGGSIVCFFGLDLEFNRTWGYDDMSHLYIAFLDRLAKSIPNLEALRLLTATEPSATEPSARTSFSQARSVYGSERCIGSGDSARVFRAMHRQTGDLVAIKRYREETSSATFFKEASIFCTLKHRHILTFHEFNVKNGVAELIMEYAVFGSLVKPIRYNKLTVEEACTTTKHTLLALQYLHGKGITHRDINPANILITTRNPFHAKIADFSVSSQAEQLNTFCGTKRYLAPEVHRPPYTAKVDIWSVGVVVMYLWGLLPRNGHDSWTPRQGPGSWTEQIVARARDVSNITTELLNMCLQLDPENRATAEQCLQLPLFHNEGGGGEGGAPFVNHLDDGVRREPPHLPDQQRQAPLAPSYDLPPEALDVLRPATANAAFAAWQGEGVAAVGLDNIIPDTAACNMQGRPLDLPAQREEHPVWNGDALEPFLPHGEGWIPAFDLQLEGWDGGENFVSLEGIPTMNPINVNAEAIGPGAKDNETLVARGIIYHFFDWRGTEIAHIPDQAMVNVTHMVATAGLRFCQIRGAQFQELIKDKKRVITGINRIRGTYMPYSNAIDVCVQLRIDTSGLPSFLS
ncbi:Serine/threonine-protein kinase 4 [Beauveria bassiana]|nr:Serine/threonine-protein kinase 4 [Beauveria bassiana]KAH8720784.1 Serine/threonine-protein kinase 4 [Beauveria bassiana]